jgi:hypothetical protein
MASRNFVFSLGMTGILEEMGSGWESGMLGRNGGWKQCATSKTPVYIGIDLTDFIEFW